MPTPSPIPQNALSATPKSTGRHHPFLITLIVLVAGAFILLIAFWMAQYTLPVRMQGSASGYEQGFRDGFNKARTIARPLLLPQVAQQPRATVTGMITAIENQTISMTVSDVIADAAVDGVGLERSFRVSPDTVIVQLRPQTDEEFLSAMRDFERWLQNPTGTPQSAPSPTVEIQASVNDLRVGNLIRVEGPLGEDMTFLDDFVAMKIILETV